MHKGKSKPSCKWSSGLCTRGILHISKVTTKRQLTRTRQPRHADFYSSDEKVFTTPKLLGKAKYDKLRACLHAKACCVKTVIKQCIICIQCIPRHTNPFCYHKMKHFLNQNTSLFPEISKSVEKILIHMLEVFQLEIKVIFPTNVYHNSQEP